MARGKHAKRKPAPRQSPPPPPPRPHLLPSATSGIVQRADGTTARAIFKLGGAEDRCSDCDEVLVDKFDTSLMCSLGHMTCFPCVAKGVQPHPICSAHCNGFKFKCAECHTWSCVSKTQELAMLCGRHSVAHDRLRKQRISPNDFERPRICTCRDVDSDVDTPSSVDSDDYDNEEPASEARAEEGASGRVDQRRGRRAVAARVSRRLWIWPRRARAAACAAAQELVGVQPRRGEVTHVTLRCCHGLTFFQNWHLATCAYRNTQQCTIETPNANSYEAGAAARGAPRFRGGGVSAHGHS